MDVFSYPIRTYKENGRKPDKVVNQYGIWDYKNPPEPYQPKGE